MNWKRYLLSTAAVLVVARGLVAFLFFGLIFDSVYDQQLPGARPEGEEVHVATLIAMLFWSLAFVYIFLKGYQNGGLSEGVRFGLITWIFYFIPMVTCYWAYFALPVNWVVASYVSGIAESMTAGLLVAFIYKSKTI
jgi:hypothetical protein